MMKKRNAFGMILVLWICLLAGCGRVQTLPTTAPETMAVLEITLPETTEPPVETTTAPIHSELFIPGVSPDLVVTWFNEVCLKAEFINSGDPTKLQKWTAPIRYTCTGGATEKDLQVLQSMVDWLNTVEGFPGIQETGEQEVGNLQIYFCDDAAYIDRMGSNLAGTDGGVTFWYNGDDEIYEGIIAYRTEVDQEIRNSVILEEIYNGLGPIQDTELRTDSIIYSGFSTPDRLTEVDELILKLLYHPRMKCGMDASACEAVIRELYY